MESCFLYKIENKLNGKLYIGLTKRPETRKYEHFYGKRLDSVSLVKQAILKYGVENFSFDIICEGSRDYIVDLEMKAITLYDTIKNGYNIRVGGEDCGSGHKISKRSDDKPLYVAGFWYPNLRVCLDKTGLFAPAIYKWQKEGTLGNTQRLRKDAVAAAPAYISGFWFDSFTRASHSLGVEEKTLRKRVRDGNIEQKNNSEGQGKSADGYHMTGKVGFDHHRSKAVEVNGVIYGSISQAAQLSDFTKKMIYNRLKNNTPGFAWVE